MCSVYNEIRERMRVYISLLVRFSGDLVTIFIELDRLSSVKWIRRQLIMIFIPEKHCLADAVETGIDHIWLSVYVEWGIML